MLILENGSFVIFIMIPGAVLSVSFSRSLNIKKSPSLKSTRVSLWLRAVFRAAWTGSARAQQCTKMGSAEFSSTGGCIC